MQIDFETLITWILSMSAIIVAVLIFYWQKRYTRFQSLANNLNKAERILRDINNSTCTAILIKDSTIALGKCLQDPKLTDLPSFKLWSFTYLYAIHSTFRLYQNCLEFVNFFEDAKREGVTEGIRRLDWVLYGLLLKMKDASEEFLKIDTSPLSKSAKLFVEKYYENESFLAQLHEKICELNELSNKCLSRIRSSPL